LLKLLDSHSHVVCRWVVLTSNELRERECRASATSFLRNAQSYDVTTHQFRDGFLPFQGERVKEVFESLKQDYSPDIIFTPYRDDLHQDHRLVSQLTWNTFRDHVILEYEIPKYDGDLSSPNFYVTLNAQHCKDKVDNLLGCYESQARRGWFSEDTFLALMRLRGIESNSPSGFAEGFYARKLVFQERQ
jgi:LmbE family N-acetylglucosaminyl deacetylase